MFNSLNSKLGLTYVLLILIVLCGVGFGLILSLRQSPLLYRNVYSRLAIAKALLVPRLQILQIDQIDQFKTTIKRESPNFQIRVAILNDQGKVIFDTDSNASTDLPIIRDLQNNSDKPENQVDTYRDTNGKVWFFTVSRISESYYLFLSLPRPVLPLKTILQDEFIGPLIKAGLIALLTALIISLVMARWIAEPLKKMVRSAQSLAEGNYQIIPLEGPNEVQQLASALNEMNRKIQLSTESQREFVANVSHELKTPITSIQGFAQAIIDGTVNTKEAIKKAGGVILNETNRLHRLVTDLLILARLEAGTADLKKEMVSINAILRNTMEKLAIIAEKSKVKLNGEFGTDVPIMGDGDRLSQVFSNLLDNAIKYSPPNKKIEIRTKIDDASYLILIKDSGPGIEEDDKFKIFERFYQVDKSRKGGEGRGVGLGLAITKQILMAHGGKIWVESDGRKGSTFVVKLPLEN
jgi:two-component system, OmpR family, sensor kinase